MGIIQQYSSKNTSINSNKLPVIYSKIEKLIGLNDIHRIFDVGGGKFDNAQEMMKKTFNIDVLIYDKYNRTNEHNLQVLSELELEKADASVISNVLNVIKEREVQKSVLDLAIKATRINGTVIVKVYEGDKSGIGAVSKKDCWQENKKMKEYHELFTTNKRVKHRV